MNLKELLTTACTANTAEKRELMRVSPTTYCENTQNSEFKVFALPAVVEIRSLRELEKL